MRKPYIICIDDEKIVLNSLIGQLKNYFGDQVIVEAVESGEEALEVISEYMDEFQQEPHLIISDQIMPQMKGDEVLSIINEEHPRAKKILLTGQADKEDLIKIINSTSLYRYIEKPWDNVDLNITVKEALRAYDGEIMVENQQKELVTLNQDLERKVLERTRQLEEKNDEILSGIRYAKKIQDGILPDFQIIEDSFPDSFLLHRPLDLLSGDFFWCAEVDGNYIIAVTDCTGHGVPGALMSIIGNDLLNDVVMINRETDPGTILNKLDEGVNRVLKQENTGLRDGMDMALCCIDRKNNKLHFSGAVNTLYYIKEGKLVELVANRWSIGDTRISNNNFETTSLSLDQIEHIYMSSDGYFDQFGGEYDRKFSSKQFKELIEQIQGKSMSEQSQLLNTSIDAWKQDRSQVDDIMVVGISL